jgi:hypothetical protein
MIILYKARDILMKFSLRKMQTKEFVILTLLPRQRIEQIELSEAT